MVKHGIVSLALSAIIATPVSAFTSVNYHEVNAVNETSFEVVHRPGTGPSEIWCAAADFAQVVLRLRSNARLYIAKEPSPSVTRPGRKASLFSTVRPAGIDPNAPQPLTLDLKHIGNNVSVASAWMYCTDHWLRDF